MFKLNYTFSENSTSFTSEQRKVIESEYAPLFFEPLFSRLTCDHTDHVNFPNEVSIVCDAEQPTFDIEKICCADFEKKVKESLG